MVIKADLLPEVLAFPCRIKGVDEVDRLIGIARIRERAEIEIILIVRSSGDFEESVFPS